MMENILLDQNFNGELFELYTGTNGLTEPTGSAMNETKKCKR